jgi:hypothetical protein
MQALAVGVERRVVQVYASSAARTSAFTAAGISPTEGMLCWLQDIDVFERHDGTSWLRLDWNTSWGVVGGQSYLGSGNLAIGVISEGYVNMNSGAVTTIAGRRYRLNFGVHVQIGVAGSSAITIMRDGVTTGSTAMGPAVPLTIPSSGTFGSFGSFPYEPASTAAHTFGLTGYCAPSGAANWVRGNQAYVEVVDIGPAGKIVPQ